MFKAQNTGKKIAIGALVAGAVGYVAGLLTAPKSGKETREDISDKVHEVKDEAVEQLQNLQLELDSLIKDSKEKTVNLSSKAREEFNEAVIRAKDAKNKVATLLKSVKAGQADDPDLNKAMKQAKAAIKNLKGYFQN
ncbi:MAG TPA: YtxH domain-containing protein [Candidatus Saccharimonadales bacterium]|nr:YtxH domain-containing protein [Candidatus Saccharimonadales bacterium]